jgi:arsenical pump membrane protein
LAGLNLYRNAWVGPFLPGLFLAAPMPLSTFAIWSIAALATAGVILRPFRWPEAIWAVAGAALLVLSGLMSWRTALLAVGKGSEVYLFLTGMMLLSEVARREGLFDWLAAYAVKAARGSTQILFVLIFGVGIGVTAILSNDATAVVLTPAVFAASRKARVDPLPFLFICAFVANAASFLLPISNPANLVVYGGHMPPLGAWLAQFLLPSVVAIAATFFILRWAERDRLRGACAPDLVLPQLSRGGKIAFAAIGLTALVLPAVSALDIPLGLPTAIMGASTLVAVLLFERASPWAVVRRVSWPVLPLVAGLFVLVESLAQTGVVAELARVLSGAAATSVAGTAAGAGAIVGFASNLTNNLPAGLIASATLSEAHVPKIVTDCVLIGVDLGPNLSITGSLATILWLSAIRREGGADIGFWRFLKLGAVVMPPALALALAARLLLG